MDRWTVNELASENVKPAAASLLFSVSTPLSFCLRFILAMAAFSLFEGNIANN